MSRRPATPIAVLYLAAFGAFDIAFQMLNDYFLGKSLQSGGARQTPRPNSRRYTNILFAAPLAPLRKDPRFAVLVQTIGLEDYWRATNSLPDYRR